jgi:dipeptidyl aminopeptidase/acylaminoacyl peptidase
MVLTERWRDGGRLIIVDETGDRLAPLLVPGAAADGTPAVDEHPAFSPDGRWVVFASSRGRADRRTSLWIAAAHPDAVPRRLTTGAADVDPTWTPEGDAVVFASDRGGVSIDLYRLPMRDGAAAGSPTPLTDALTHELAPSMVGARLVMQIVEPTGGASRIAERTADGALVALTDGPSDGAPALAPDGTTLAYAAARLRADGERDLDVIVVDAEGRERAGIALEGTDEGAPAWSSDGRWLFVTSIVRDVEGAPLLSSVVHLDTWARPPKLRMLRDAAGAAPRLGASLARGDLDQTSLLRNPDYATALRYALLELEEAAAAERARQEARGRRDSSPPSTLAP